MTTGTTILCVILNFAPVELLILDTAGFRPWAGTASFVALFVNTQFSVHDKIKFISQLINDISSVLQKLLKYFNGTISTYFSVLLPS